VGERKKEKKREIERERKRERKKEGEGVKMRRRWETAGRWNPVPQHPSHIHTIPPTFLHTHPTTILYNPINQPISLKITQNNKINFKSQILFPCFRFSFLLFFLFGIFFCGW
jgi:hypothetical protein